MAVISISRLGGFSAAFLAVAGFGLAAGTPSADAQESFYKGKTINVVIRSGPGGGNDTYGRLVARHIVNHLPGNPGHRATNMPGGGGLVAANYIAQRAQRDGTEIGILDRDLPVAQRLGATGVQYDVRTLTAIGSAASETFIWVARGNHQVKTVRDLRNYNGVMRFSGTGAGTTAVQQVVLLKSDGFPVDVVTGYANTAEKVLAIVRGDVEATTGTYESLLDGIRNEGLSVIARLGRHPDLTAVPDLREIMSADRAKVMTIMAAPLEAGRPFYGPPDIPADRVKLLREAFRAALHDPKLLEEAKRSRQSVNWMSGEDVEKSNKEILASPDNVVSLFRAL